MPWRYKPLFGSRPRVTDNDDSKPCPETANIQIINDSFFFSVSCLKFRDAGFRRGNKAHTRIHCSQENYVMTVRNGKAYGHYDVTSPTLLFLCCLQSGQRNEFDSWTSRVHYLIRIIRVIDITLSTWLLLFTVSFVLQNHNSIVRYAVRIFMIG